MQDHPKEQRSQSNPLHNIEHVSDPCVLPPSAEQAEIRQGREPSEHENRNCREQNGAVRQAEIKAQKPSKDQSADDQTCLKQAGNPMPIVQEEGWKFRLHADSIVCN